MSAREETLDPEDWSELKKLGHQMVDDMVDYARTLRERPVWKPTPDSMHTALSGSVPLEPLGLARAYQEFRETVLPWPSGNQHPRFWAWAVGNGTPSGMFFDLLAAGLNPNCGGGDQVAVLIEHQVLGWLKHALGYPDDASGILVTGASMATTIGLAVARNRDAGCDVRSRGIGAAGELVIYAAQESHSCIQKALELLGIGTQGLRRIAVDARFAMDLDALKAAIAEDRAAGRRPLCVVGTAGSVNTGSFDPLDAIADLCAAERLWFHVDGAFGSLAALSPELAVLTRGQERADSIAFDLHKWLHVPYDVGCVLVRDRDAHHKTFASHADYLSLSERGRAGGPLPLASFGPQLSRGFRALKIWMTLKEHGLHKFGRLIDQNVAQARYLERLIIASPRLEVLAPVPLNVVCFRYVRAGLDAAALDALNDELVVRLQLEGRVLPSSTRIHGRHAVRVCIINHRSRREDFDLLVRECERIGDAL